MPTVAPAMTGRTVGATTSFAVKNQTSGNNGKPVLPLFGRSSLKHKKRKKHHSEWFNRSSLKLVEYEEAPPTGLDDTPLRRNVEPDPSEKAIIDWHQKNKLPWPGVILPKGKVTSALKTPMVLAKQVKGLRSLRSLRR